MENPQCDTRKDRNRILPWKLIWLLLIILPVPGFFLVDKVVYSFEKRDTFCIACHLHEKKYKEFTAQQSVQVSLAAKHHAPKGVRCIDCHKGEGFWERLGVLTIAGFDTVVYFVGIHKEPQHLRFPLDNTTCLKCHEKDLIPKGSYSTNYHDLTPHANLSLRCAQCHLAHPRGNPQHVFLNESEVIPICKRCHVTMFY